MYSFQKRSLGTFARVVLLSTGVVVGQKSPTYDAKIPLSRHHTKHCKSKCNKAVRSLRTHRVFKGTFLCREAEMVTNVSNTIGASGVAVAVVAFGFDDQRC